MGKNTVILTIPKEKALNIITNEINGAQGYEREDGGIDIKYKGDYRCTLHDYVIPESEVKSDSGSVKAGQRGTRMHYKKSNYRAKVSKYAF